MNSQRFTTILTSLVLLLGVLSALDVVTPDLSDTATLTTAEAARSGSWTCPAPGLAAGEEVTLVGTAAPGGRQPSTGVASADGVVELTTAIDPVGGSGVAAEVTYDRFGSSHAERVARSAPFPEQAVDATVGHPQFPVARDEFAVAARWRRQPAVIGRSWTRSAEFGPTGLLSAPCIAGVSSSWFVPGLSTAGGAEATLVLANPFVTDASVTVTLAGRDGAEQPALLENVVVPAQSVQLLPINEHAPERADVGIVVSTRSGRVVVEALQSVNAAIGGIEAVTVVPASAVGASTWTVPWVATTVAFDADEAATLGLEDTGDTVTDDEVADGDVGVTSDEGLDGEPASWVWVTNVGDDDAVLLLTIHGRDGGRLVELGEDPVLAPGAVRRIDLVGPEFAAQDRAAVTIATENDVPIVASVATQVVEPDDEDRTGLVVQLGAAAPDTVWVLTGEPAAGRRQFVSLVNPGGELATVAISLWTSAGIVRPEQLQAIEVPAGTRRLVDVTGAVDTELAANVVYVQAVTGEIVAGRLGFSPEDRLELVAGLGVPSAVWRGGTLVPTTRFDPSLTGGVQPKVDED